MRWFRVFDDKTLGFFRGCMTKWPIFKTRPRDACIFIGEIDKYKKISTSRRVVSKVVFYEKKRKSSVNVALSAYTRSKNKKNKYLGTGKSRRGLDRFWYADSIYFPAGLPDEKRMKLWAPKASLFIYFFRENTSFSVSHHIFSVILFDESPCDFILFSKLC